jgi:hypothetical protein
MGNYIEEVLYLAMKPEIDPASMLSHFSGSRSTGCLEVVCGDTRWSVLFESGQLLSVDCSVQSLGQLSHRLRQLGRRFPNQICPKSQLAMS